MDNLDIIILTTVISTLFVVFFVAMYKELSKVEKEGWKYDPNAKKYGREALFVLMAKLFDDEQVPKKDKKTIHKAITRTISDMESDGVYFSDDAKEEFKKQADEYFCSYSGLPSVTSYSEPIKKKILITEENRDEFFIGHS